jgi:hypothetical protein
MIDLLQILKSYFYVETPSDWISGVKVKEIDYHQPIKNLLFTVMWIHTLVTGCIFYSVRGYEALHIAVVICVLIDWDSRPTMVWTKRRNVLMSWAAILMILPQFHVALFVAVTVFKDYLISDGMIEYYRSYGPKPLRLKNGGLYGSHWMPTALNRKAASENLCAWKCVFAVPELAQQMLAVQPDGKMTAELLNHLNAMGLIQLWTIAGRHCLNGVAHYGWGIIVYVDEGHAAGVVPAAVKEANNMVVKQYDGPSVGILLPKPIFRRMRFTRELVDLEKDVATLKGRIDTTLTGMVAEAGYIAGREELDIFYELCRLPDPNELVPSEVARTYLTKTKWRAFDCPRQQWVRGPSMPSRIDYEVNAELNVRSHLAWNGSEIVYAFWKNKLLIDVTKDPEGTIPAGFGRYLIVPTDLPYRRGLAYVATALKVLDVNHVSEARLHEGVPSCGKTTNIKTLMGPNDLYTVPTAKGAAECVEAGYNAKTIDALIVNGWSEEPINTLYVDEGLLTHPGAIEMCIRLTSCKECKVFGDRNQLKYVVRLPHYLLINPDYPWTQEPVYNPQAWKTPQIICDILAPLYAGGYICMSGVMGQVFKNHIKNKEGVKLGHDVYLTYTQVEKAILSYHMTMCLVLTINEAQGLRFEDPALVRLYAFDIGIYDSTAQNLVAISRSSKFFTYYTVKTGDTMWRWLTTGKATRRESVAGRFFKTLPYFTSGGRNTLRTQGVSRLNDVPEHDTYELWREQMLEVGDVAAPKCLAFTTAKTVEKLMEWDMTSVWKPDPITVQAVMDSLYHQRMDDIAFGDHLNWPFKWPDGMKIDMVKSSKTPALIARPALTPRLKTPQPPRALNHPLDEAQAFAGRVINAPRQKLTYSYELADELVCRVLEKCFVMGRVHASNVELPLDNEEMKKLWWSTRSESKRMTIYKCEGKLSDGCKYYVLVRGDHKSKLDDSHEDATPTGQLVTAMSPFWSSLFAPIFQTMLVKVLASLKPNIVFNTRMTWEELDSIVDNLLTDKFFQSLELDIGKFDKSQDETMLDAQCALFQVFGMDVGLIELWRAYHELCKLSSPKWGASFWVAHQRRSGDPLTWFGNTLVLLMILAYLYPIDEAYLVLVGGDDNFCAFPTGMKIEDKAKEASEVLNFELKPLSFQKSIYFSSRFILLTRNGWITIADPVKLMVRLGRNDMQGREHLKAVHDSWIALHYKYGDQEVRDLVNYAACDRYQHTLGFRIDTLYVFVNAVANIVQNYKYLEEFYEGTEFTWNLTLDPRERVGGGLYEKLIDVYTDVI